MVEQRPGTELRIESEDGSAFGGYLSRPASGRGPGVIVVQEWWGLVDQVRDVCDRFAREGFVALAPDLYRGESTADPDAASRMMMDLEIPRAVGDLQRAVHHLLSHDATDGGRVGCIGFCMGGQLALAAACATERIAAVVDCYGIHPNVELDLPALRAKVLGLFAENDEFVPPEAARSLESRLREAGVDVSFHIYVGVQHAFMNHARADVYDAPTADQAWGELLPFLRAELE